MPGMQSYDIYDMGPTGKRLIGLRVRRMSFVIDGMGSRRCQIETDAIRKGQAYRWIHGSKQAT